MYIYIYIYIYLYINQVILGYPPVRLTIRSLADVWPAALLNLLKIKSRVTATKSLNEPTN